MDYYHENKQNYCELVMNKNQANQANQTNQVGGMDKNKNTKPIFILFHGFGSSKFWFEYQYDKTSKPKKLNFVDELKKIGEVYSFTSKFFNVDYYFRNKDPKQRANWIKLYKTYSPHTPDIDFDLEDLDYDVICKKVYDELVDKFGNIGHKQLIPICHSYGSEIGVMFTKMYQSKCLFLCLLDGVFHSLKLQKQLYEKFEKKNKKMIEKKFGTNEDLHKVLDRISNSPNDHTNITKSVNKDINNVLDLVSYKSDIYKMKHFSKVLPVKTIFFRSLAIDDKNLDKDWNKWANSEKEYVMKYNKDDMYKFIFLINAPHFLWYDQHVSDMIINEIKSNLNPNCKNK